MYYAIGHDNVLNITCVPYVQTLYAHTCLEKLFGCLPHYALSDVIKIMLEIVHLCMTHIIFQMYHTHQFNSWCVVRYYPRGWNCYTE